jgi:two-component system response regulator PhoP
MKLAYISALFVGFCVCSFDTAKSNSLETLGLEMKGKRILLVIDEPSRKETLANRLRRAEFVVTAVDDGEAALDISRKQQPDIAVADFSLSKMSGTDLVKALRAQHGNLFPILVLTNAHTKWQGTADIVEAGADDTLHEANNKELEDKIFALLYRWDKPFIVCGPIRFDNRVQTAEFEGRSLDLTVFEYKVLEYLVTHAGQWMTGMSIVEHLYTQEHDRTPEAVSVVSEFVERLSKKMDPAGTRQPIEISDHGYRISCQ